MATRWPDCCSYGEWKHDGKYGKCFQLFHPGCETCIPPPPQIRIDELNALDRLAYIATAQRKNLEPVCSN